MNIFSFFGMSQFFPVRGRKGYKIYLGFLTMSENDSELTDLLDVLIPRNIHRDQVYFVLNCQTACELI